MAVFINWQKFKFLPYIWTHINPQPDMEFFIILPRSWIGDCRLPQKNNWVWASINPLWLYEIKKPFMFILSIFVHISTMHGWIPISPYPGFHNLWKIFTSRASAHGLFHVCPIRTHPIRPVIKAPSSPFLPDPIHPTVYNCMCLKLWCAYTRLDKRYSF